MTELLRRSAVEKKEGEMPGAVRPRGGGGSGGGTEWVEGRCSEKGEAALTRNKKGLVELRKKKG